MRTGRKAVALLTLISISVCLLCGCRIPFLWKRQASKEVTETVSSYLDAFISGNRNISGTYVQGGVDPLNSITASPVHEQIASAVKARMTYEIGEIEFDEDTGDAMLTVSMTFPDVQALYAADTMFSYDLDTFVSDVASTDMMYDYAWDLSVCYSEKNEVWELFSGSCENLAADMRGFTGEGIVFREISDSEALATARSYFTEVQNAGLVPVTCDADSNLNEYIREIIYGMEFSATYTLNDDNTKTVHLTVSAPSQDEINALAFSSPDDVADYVAEVIVHDLNPDDPGDPDTARGNLYPYLSDLVGSVGTSDFEMDVVVGVESDGNLEIRNREDLSSWADRYMTLPEEFPDEAYDAAIRLLVEQGRLSAEDYAFITDGPAQDTPAATLNKVPAEIAVPEFAGDMTVVEGESNNVFTYSFLDSTGTQVSDFYTADDRIVFHIQTNDFYDVGTVFYYNVYFNGEKVGDVRSFGITEDFSDIVNAEFVSAGGLEAGQYIITVFDPGADTVMATAHIEVS